ncbi:MAG: alpha-amylase family glycosyl hydrolase [Bacteroidota bacterium]
MPLNTLRFLLLLVCLVPVAGRAQVTVSPPYPTIDDAVTITYNTTQGNAALVGVSPVFAHTGVLTSTATDPGDWTFQISDWFSGFDSTILMTPGAGPLHSISFTPRNFYGIGGNVEPKALAFVFRNETGTLAGKNADNSDILVPIYPDSAFCGVFASHPVSPSYYSPGDSVNPEVRTNAVSSISVFRDGVFQGQASTSQSFIVGMAAGAPGKYELTFQATQGANTYTDTAYYVVEAPVAIGPIPTGMRDGINYTSNTTATLVLQAPNKDRVYAIGDFNDWEVDPAYQMNRTPDGERYWLELTGLTPGQEYRFQYLIDRQTRVGDPWAEKVLDPFNDGGINNFVYPNLIDYPESKTEEFVAVLQTAQAPYNWQVNNFSAPDNRDLVIYELLVRDFVIRHDWQTVMDSLDYLESLGINAIELMPFNEFDGNSSWGYGPAFFAAPDKYYGTKDKLKEFIDACHARGIAVIQDVVFNHAFGQSPRVRMYQDRNTLEIFTNSPWFNQTAPHPLGLGYDFNHQSSYVHEFVDSVLSFWVHEYKVDGFRFDLSKGFTQTFTGQDIGAWSQYDLSRVNSIKRIASRLWQYHPGKWVILEHFANNNEETELANFGCMFWGKASDPYYQSAMGYEQNSDFEFAMSYQARGWSFHNLIGFMESHDEERLMYENVNFGNSWSGYDTRDTTTALERMGLVATFFFTIPGPKLLWQFGEYGYDFSINFGCRTCPKPVVWFYLNDPRRLRLKKIYAALIKLKTNYPNTFRTNSYNLSAWGKQKQIHLNAPMNATIIGNFDVVDQWTWTGFQNTGWWYEYFTGDSINVTDVNMNILLGPGEYRLFTDQRLPVPDLDVSFLTEVAAPELIQASFVETWPNPTTARVNFGIDLEESGEAHLRVADLQGRIVARVQKGWLNAGHHELTWDGRNDAGQELSSGTYLYHFEGAGKTSSGRIIIAK